MLSQQVQHQASIRYVKVLVLYIDDIRVESPHIEGLKDFKVMALSIYMK